MSTTPGAQHNSSYPGSESPSVALAPPTGAPPSSADRWMTELHALLRELETVTAAGPAPPPVYGEAVDDRLVQTRLGVATSLFAALRHKNAAIARHGLRVALTCSAWASQMDLSQPEREAIEVAALLHDIGVIGTPDDILLKPALLDGNELAIMMQARKASADIIRCGCSSTEILEIVENVGAWYGGGEEDGLPHGADIPLGARMVAIAEAFDAMTTDRVYRPAHSQERAMAELFACAGTQFDPELVQAFVDFRKSDQASIHWEVAHRWLRTLDAAMIDTLWQPAAALPGVEAAVDVLFHSRLLDNMYDAVVFIDATGRILLWNRGAERLTGISGSSVRGEKWHAELLNLSDEKGRPIGETDCPVQTAIRCGVQSLRRLTVVGRGQRSVAVDSHAIPVINEKGTSQGAILLFHDASSETSLEQRCQSLHEKATKDPMTQVANRAEFDRVHAMFVAAHQQQHVPCSLLMCDLDHFKSVNDTYGHQAGDDAIQCLASLLKGSCRPGDLVARYGGEEFVLLCADCDNFVATNRAEQIRKALSQVPQSRMGGRSVTVSFGVTEIQPGDTPETMLRRVDRALLMAKTIGRNRVVQLGAGSGDEPAEVQPAAGLFAMVRPRETLRQDLITPVPVKIAIAQLRGFVADHRAKIVAVDGNRVRLDIEEQSASPLRRLTDRPVVFRVDVSFEEEVVQKERMVGDQTLGTDTTQTKIHLAISARKNRDRRRNDVATRARQVLASFRSYLMAHEDEKSLPTRSPALTPWLEQ